jgi:hypothetical protein
MPYASDTRVPVEQTKTEIERLVVQKHAATQYMIASSSQPPRAVLQFKMRDRIIRFELPIPTKAKNEQALSKATRSRWRGLLLIVKAKLEAVETGVTTFEEEFLAHIVLPDNRTVATATLPQIALAYKSSKMPHLLAEFASPEER